jgi:uncharacterized protein YegL
VTQALTGTMPRPTQPGAPAPPVLACYLALDTSDSMSGAPLEAASAELARLRDATREDPRLATGCRLAVVTFDAEAHVQVPLTPAAELPRAPRIAITRPATDYAVAFTFLRCQITADLAALRTAGLRPVRPAVFLLTDGRPTRGYWPPAHAALTDPAWPDAPDVVAFGFGEAAESAVRRIGTAGAYLAAPGPGGHAAAPAGLLATFVSFLLASVAGAAGFSGEPPIERALPTEPPRGWRALPGRSDAV